MAESDCSDVPPKSESSTLEFFMLISRLKHMKRTGWVKNDIPDCEPIAGHMYRMGIMAFLLDNSATQPLDKTKCIKMALVHDMAECIVGDITPHCGVSKEEKHRREMEAIHHLGSLVEKEVGQELIDLFKEYEAQETPESRAVMDLDKFDMILQAYEYEQQTGRNGGLQQFFDSTQGVFKTSAVMKWVDELNTLRTKDSAS